MKREYVDIEIEGVNLKIAVIVREGEGVPLVFLHGFGSTKESYADAMRCSEFKGRRIIAYDAPGCGESECSDLTAISIPFLVKVAEKMLRYFEISAYHLCGHSMGGLTSLMLLDGGKYSAISFTDIEGNVAPEDCFLSRQIVEFATDNAEDFFEAFIDRMRDTPGFSNPLYSAGLRAKVKPQAVGPIFRSMVDLSDNAGLMDRFLGLPCAKMFVYGDENTHLSYLCHLAEHGVRVEEIENSAHFPMYSNAPALWRAMGNFIDNAEKA